MQVGVDFTHVIMTRFNVARPKRHDPVRLDPGLAGRAVRSLREILPALGGGADPRETSPGWSTSTPPRRSRCATGSRPAGGSIPSWPISPGRSTPPSGRARSRRRWRRSTPWLLTTRFDNDDALAGDHVARLQAAVAAAGAAEARVAELSPGLRARGRPLYALTHLANPFASWLEPWGDKTRTAISINHLKMTRAGAGHPARGRRGLAAGGARRQCLEQGARPPGAAGRGRRPLPGVGARRPARASGLEIALENLLLTPIRSARDTAVSMVRGHERVVK